MLAFATHSWAQSPFTVMSYNVENAFDTIHDEGKNDYEYCEGGERKWSKKKLFQKLRNVSKVIVAADERRPIDLVALCEVENDTVLNYLVHRTPLNRLDYRYIMTNSADARGIDVALLYSPFTFHPFDIQRIRPHLPKHATRDILHVAGTLNMGDTLDVYVVHLPSKAGGPEAHGRSMKVTRMLKANIDSVAKIRRKKNFIVMGDLNAEPNSPQLKHLTKGTHPRLTDQSARLTPGTYKYQGEWSVIDHILTFTSSLTPTQSQALALPFLVMPDATNGGTKPNRTYLGPVYKGGTSDHLPIVTRFKIKLQK